jgi:putative flavoprotein involved in K+ transport
MNADVDRHEVIVIGGGQAGLALGYHLAHQRRRFTILDAGDSPAAAWRSRWDSLTLFTPARYNALPGRAFPSDPDHYPTRDEVVEYLTDYARDFELPIELNALVRAVRAVRAREHGYLVQTDDRTYTADQVVIATGPFQTPRIPSIARDLAADVQQLHSSDYQRADDIADGPVLVVGGGNTGFQIAHELAATHEVHLAIGSRQTPLPQQLLGRDLFTILTATGLMGKTVDSRLGRRLRDRDALIGSSPRAIRTRGVHVRPRATGAAGSTITFADESTLRARTVIWATGFGADYSYLDAPVFSDDGAVIHTRGVTAAPGLYFLGMPWQHTRGSALLGWVKDDAQHIADKISQLSRGRADAPTNRSRPAAAHGA